MAISKQAKRCNSSSFTCRHLFIPRNGNPDWCRKYQVIIDRDDRKRTVMFEKCSGVELPKILAKSKKG